jgi:hypothetical protein
MIKKKNVKKKLKTLFLNLGLNGHFDPKLYFFYFFILCLREERESDRISVVER